MEYHFGNDYFILGNNQNPMIDGATAPMVFIMGNNIGAQVDFCPAASLFLYGSDITVDQYGGELGKMTVAGYNDSDTLNFYALCKGAVGTVSHPTTGNLTSDGHGGTNLSFGTSGTVDFLGTSERTLLAGHITGSVR